MRIKIAVACMFCMFLHADDALTALTKEQHSYINSLSRDELYDVYVEQHIQGREVSQPDFRAIMARKNNRAKYKKCMLDKTKQAFSYNELKELYAQSMGMDRSKYDRKLSTYYNELLPQCGSVLSK